MNVLGNATTYGIYIFRAFVRSRFLMGFWLSPFETDISRGQLSLGKPPAVNVICDLTPTLKKALKFLQAEITPDGQGYYGYHRDYRAYYEVSTTSC
jgi:hypothetical protein